MMLGFLLARAGVDVLVLEKHADFLRDFRGDTIHPSTLEVMHELGLLDQFLKLPHQKVRELSGVIGDETVTFADFSHLPTRCHFIAFMPQWDFLDFLTDQGKRYPGFKLKMQAEVDDLIMEWRSRGGPEGQAPARHARGACRSRGRRRRPSLGGARARRPRSRGSRRTDGRAVAAALQDAPAMARKPLGRIQAGRLFVMLDRGDYWQCAYVIPKGGFNEIRCKGLDAFRQDIARLNPALADRVHEIASWDDVKLLTVRVDRLKRWYRPGLLCIGDAAHAMSPVGGVGINLAIQDAVAAANILAEPLREGAVSDEVLRKVQERRQWPTRMTQALQIFMQNRVIRNVLSMTNAAASAVRGDAAQALPVACAAFPARLIGMGFRPSMSRESNRRAISDP